MQSRRIKVFFDGGARPNPGPIEVAVVARGRVHYFDDLGTGSNSDAEWLALILALDLAQKLALDLAGPEGPAAIELIGDALEVVRQANRALAAPGCARGHAATLVRLAAANPPKRIRWIKRAQNLAGVALAARHCR